MKILVIRFSSIGDIVLTSPVIRCLKKQIPGLELHFLTKVSFEKMLQNNPYLNKVYAIKKDVNEVLPALKNEQYDYIIDLHHNLRSLQVKSALRKKSFSFNKININKWLVVNLKINTLPALHIVDRYFETTKSLNISNDEEGLDYFIADNDEVDIKTLPVSHQSGYIGIVIGAKHFTKRLPDEKTEEICRLLNYPVVLLGGKEDAERGSKISSANTNNIYNACGKYSLSQSASLIKQSKIIITNDTGLMHIAAAYKKNIISVWGNTIPEFGMTPYLPLGEYGSQSGKRLIFEVKGLSCRPCSKIGYDKCPKGHFKCMNDININDIVNSVQRCLQNDQ